MTYNQINDLGLTFLAQALGHNEFLMSFKLFGNNFGQESLKIFYELFKKERKPNWYPDFVVYWVDDHYEMAYLETDIEKELGEGVIKVCE